jgi:hypothetical protein
MSMLIAVLLLTLFIGFPVSRIFGLRATLNGPVGDLRGTLNGWTYSIWKAGVQVIRKAANVISNPSSADQALVRCYMSMLTKYWFDTLTQDMRENWNTWALTEPGKGNKDGGVETVIKGNNGKMSGFNAFCMSNMWNRTAGISADVITAAPLGVTAPTPPLSVAAVEAAGTVTVTWLDPLIKGANARVRIWGVSRENLMHRQLLATEPFAAGTKDILSFKGAGGASILFADVLGHFVIQMDTVDDTGTKSGPSNVAEFTIA